MSGPQALRSSPTVTALSGTMGCSWHFMNTWQMRQEYKKHNKKATEEGSWEWATLQLWFQCPKFTLYYGKPSQFTEDQKGRAQLSLLPSSGSIHGMLGNSLSYYVPFNPNKYIFFFSLLQYKHSKNTILTFPGAHSVPSSGGPFLVLQKYGLSGWLHHNCLHGSKVRNWNAEHLWDETQH